MTPPVAAIIPIRSLMGSRPLASRGKKKMTVVDAQITTKKSKTRLTTYQTVIRPYPCCGAARGTRDDGNVPYPFACLSR
jgi:hypothetical protein